MSLPVAPKMTERELSQSIVDAARSMGWRVYRTWNSIHSPRGFPDLCMVRGRRLIFAELKADKGVVTEAQQAWLDDLSEVMHAVSWCKVGAAMHWQGEKPRELPSVEVYTWRPADLEAAYAVLLRAA